MGIYVIDRVGIDKYEVYGVIGFRRYEYMSRNEAKKRYEREVRQNEAV